MVKVFVVEKRSRDTWRLDLVAVPRVGDKVRVMDETDAEVKEVLWLAQPYEYAAKLEVTVPVRGRLL